MPSLQLATLVDDASAAERLSAAFQQADRRIDVLVDLDVGQGRTGIRPGPAVIELYQRLAELPGLRPKGLHAYDGHVRQTDLAARRQACDAALAPAEACHQLQGLGYDESHFVVGGTPTFPIHARHADRQLSPGTCVLWDAGYATIAPDLDFLFAAVLLMRVVSKPAADCICVDLGHKAVAADPKGSRVVFPELPDAEPLVHSEEHLVLRTDRASSYAVGDVLYGIPWHVCPTCASMPVRSLYPTVEQRERGESTHGIDSHGWWIARAGGPFRAKISNFLLALLGRLGRRLSFEDAFSRRRGWISYVCA